MTTPEQTNERPGTGSGADGALQPDDNEAGRPRIRPGPPGDSEPAADRAGDTPPRELTPDESDAGRPRIRPGPGEG